MKKQHFILIIVILAAGLAFGIYFLSNQKKSYQNTEISYNRDIRPILSDKCFLCHGPDANTREAGLRLDLQEGAFAELLVNKGHFAVVPGSPEESELIRRIESTDPAVLMPLPESNLPQLTPEEIAVFKQWIKEGAKYEKHWSFIPPVQTDLPDVKKESWVKNEIDNFILEKIEKKGLKPNDEASREILIKRAFADITGLAPISEEINYWAGNSEKNWYSQLIDTLLQKPAYGEKMAILWMDLGTLRRFLRFSR
jgi:hypothetical protein